MDDRIVVAVETSTREAGYAVWTGTEFLAGRLSAKRRHSVELVPSIAELLAAAGISAACVDRWVVALGPGSYTGLRVGISAAAGMAMPYGKRPVGVSTYDVLAQQYFMERGDGKRGVIIASDARRGEWHAAYYAADEWPMGPDRGEPRRMPAHDVAGLKKRTGAEIVLSAGPGAPCWGEGGWHVMPPSPEILAEMGLLLPEPDPAGFPPEPIYLRPAVFVAPGPIRGRGEL